jgi:hypothetical protein
MDFAGTTGGFKKLNNTNSIYWKACIESSLQGQDLWEVVGGSETTLPKVATEEIETTSDPKTKEKKALAAENEALQKWRIKAGKAMYVHSIC